jgi:hypothetical protein
MLCAAKCYWPSVTPADLEQVAARAAKARSGTGRDEVAYLGSLLFAADDLVLCLFLARGRSGRMSKRGGIAAGIRQLRLGAPLQRHLPSVIPASSPGYGCLI